MRYPFTALGHEWHRPVVRWPGGGQTTAPPVAIPAPERVLLPLSLRVCPVEAFQLVNRVAERGRAAVLLLHVLQLNIPIPENRVYDDLGHEARYEMDWLARRYLHPGIEVALRVRLGSPVEQIVATAKAEGVGLVLLSTRGPSFWARWCSFGKPAAALPLSRLSRKIVCQAPCSVMVLPPNPSRARGEAPLASTARAAVPAVAGA